MKLPYQPRAFDMIRSAKQQAIKDIGSYDLWSICDKLEFIAKRRANGNCSWWKYLEDAGVYTTGDVKEILKAI